ncbi:zinc finger, mynd-type domain containing protein [Grosmannia clavigera kw1407]|uniref:Zinc finger, mynd-type domain containing protein n=1 Tax=Grosmannia clavigera (strain kw1407 / UAMH 11150) TaxID=655863 RepID=F0XFS0_GROCL|nr:zinc finger, mynd-type domain containing protein [Grosmannia clavigera kw1407]EFX04102.1 zinc finger, mynd-type domain containing protein [Grosmannia clavigera kw1407]
MSGIPDLDDRTLFPPFLDLPEAEDGDAATEKKTAGQPALLAQVKNNMTINKPTLVLSDRDGHSFALVFDGLDRDGLDLEGLGFRPGTTILVPAARRTIPAARADDGSSSPETINSKAARRPFLRIPAGQADTVQVMPAALDQVVAAASRLRLREQQHETGQDRQCSTCGTTPDAGPAAKRLLKCTGCSEAWYCNKACQTQGWKDGHKGECKAIRAVATVWGS